MIKIKIYKTQAGSKPFVKWYTGLKDKTTQLRIRKKLGYIRNGNLGDSKPVGAGVYEFRFFFGSGYRIYYAKDGETIILLLCGGDKNSQSEDIEKAKFYWKDYKNDENNTIH